MTRLFALTAIFSVCLFSSHAKADLVVDYQSGVSATAGTTGASDPTTQGWTANAGSGTTAFSHGLDSTIGGWRITDGTGSAPFFYQQNLSGTDTANMNSLGWIASWTTAMNADAINSGGGGVDDYYANNPNLQNDNAMWIEVSGSYRYILTFETDANGDIFLDDGTTQFQITNTGNNLSQELGAGSPSATYVSFSLAYNASSGNATLTDSLGGSHGVIATNGAAGANRVVWGATSSSGQGSTTWNNLSLNTIPEPSSLALLAIGLSGIVLRRKR